MCEKSRGKRSVSGGRSETSSHRWGEQGALRRFLTVPNRGSLADQRRAQSLLIITTGLIIAAIPTTAAVALLLPRPLVSVTLILFGFGLYLVIRQLVLAGQVSLAAWCLVGYFIAMPIAGVILNGRVEASPLFLVLIVVVAASTLPPREVLVAAGIAFTELAFMFSMDLGLSIDVTKLLGYVAVALFVVTAAALVMSLAIDRALASADSARRRAERLANDLKAANTELENRVTARTEQLREALRREQVLSARMGELSLRDSLTGLHNRRHLDDELQRMFAAARRSGDPLSVAVIDLDDFKAVNDAHTHLVGDDVLRGAAKALLANVRASDVLIRMGGEEFALLMPGTSSDAAVAVCDRMRSELALHDWSTIRPGLVVTASIGVSSSVGQPTAADLLRSADILLYQAKREGKNRVVTQSPGTAAHSG
jgi:diguanylate cyclase (GGDEF)-like protein